MYSGARALPGGDPRELRVHAIHDRYLREVVEGLGLCPFARRSREQGRVHRPVFWLPANERILAQRAARCVDQLTHTHPDVEIILVTFVGPPSGRFDDPETFEAFVKQMRAAHEAAGQERWFMVAFHPALDVPDDRPTTPDSLVQLIRRSPDPVVQCVRAEVLEHARRQAQRAAHARLMQTLAQKDPVLQALLKNSVQPDSELSREIAERNFRHVGAEAGLQELRAVLDAIRAERDETYAPWFPRP
jgi:hypothetical protein